MFLLRAAFSDYPQSTQQHEASRGLSAIAELLVTQRCRDTRTVTWTTRHYNHFNSEHYKVSNSDVFGKVIAAADFRISADDMYKQEVKVI